jgi:hypothetical protein
MKKKHMVFPSLGIIIHFGPLTFQSIKFQSLTIIEIQTSFFYCVVPNLRKKKWLDFNGREKKSRFRPIPARKTNDFGVTEFLLMGRVYPRCSPLKLAWNGISKPEKNFGFRLIVGFRANFWIVRSYKYILQGV